MPVTSLLYKRNAQVITVILMDASNQPVDNAVGVTANLVDSSGEPVISFPTNLPLSYVAGSRGRYQGTVPSSFNQAVGSGYILTVLGTSGSSGFCRSFPVVIVS